MKKTDRTKYKTELCKTYMERTLCVFGKNCRFAHGYDELREQVILNNKYRSKTCKAVCIIKTFRVIVTGRDPSSQNSDLSTLYTLHRYFLLPQLNSTRNPANRKQKFSINAAVVVIGPIKFWWPIPSVFGFTSPESSEKGRIRTVSKHRYTNYLGFFSSAETG